MDPRIHAEEAGSSPDSSNCEEPANYLRRLKGNGVKATPADTAVTGGNVLAATANAVFNERRQVPRIRCSGSVEFHADGTDVRMWGTLTDVSLHGCYVEMNTTFPVDTKVHLVLKSFGVRVQARGTVRATYPFLGMGIVFTEIEPGQQLQLEQLLATLAGRNAIAIAESPDGSGMKDTLASADPRAFLDEVAEFFRKKALLSREEFCEIAKRVRRS